MKYKGFGQYVRRLAIAGLAVAASSCNSDRFYIAPGISPTAGWGDRQLERQRLFTEGFDDASGGVLKSYDQYLQFQRRQAEQDRRQ